MFYRGLRRGVVGFKGVSGDSRRCVASFKGFLGGL